MKFGLIGNPLKHSHSPELHAAFGIEGYRLCEVLPEDLDGFFRRRDFAGINVTIPYKQAVIKYLDYVDEGALACGAVNTVINDNGKLLGFNTDIEGMGFALSRAGISLNGKSVLVLGSGGTSHTAQALARREGARCIRVASRSGEIDYGNVYSLNDVQIVVNTTPVGMYPDTEKSPLDLSRFPALEGVFDAVFNPLCTRFAAQAKSLGIPCGDGLLMLAAQAMAAKKIFLGECRTVSALTPEEGETVVRATRELKRALCNIVLEGMPSSGKSTVGRLVAEKTGKAFVDTDAVIETRTGKSIPQIFAEQGEKGFRAIESETVAECSLKQGCVIATGGGAVLSERNRLNLKANGVIVWLKRDTRSLSCEGRPLSTDAERLKTMYEERRPVYETFADITADNNGAPEKTAEEIVRIYGETI